MKKPVSVVAIFALAALFAGGCASTDGDKKESEASKVYVELDMAKSLGAEMIAAFCSGDYNKFTGFLPAGEREKISRSGFVRLSRKYKEALGEQSKVEYLTEMRQGDAVFCLWKVTFEKDSGNGGGKTYTDMLYRLSLSNENGKSSISGFGWQSL